MFRGASLGPRIDINLIITIFSISRPLKQHIEDLLEEDARIEEESVIYENILSLIGIAKPLNHHSDFKDDKLEYILSK